MSATRRWSFHELRTLVDNLVDSVDYSVVVWPSLYVNAAEETGVDTTEARHHVTERRDGVEEIKKASEKGPGPLLALLQSLLMASGDRYEKNITSHLRSLGCSFEPCGTGGLVLEGEELMLSSCAFSIWHGDFETIPGKTTAQISNNFN